MPTIQHYGVTVDLEKPTTGVVQNNHVEWLHEEQGIDLAWEEHVKECKGQCGACDCRHEGEEDKECECEGVEDHQHDPTDSHDYCGPDTQGTLLIGSWKKDAEGLYEPDPDAPNAEFAAIVGEVYTQVVWSKTVVRVKSLCSPCYPGQADVDRDKIVAEGGYLAYDFPADMWGSES